MVTVFLSSSKADAGVNAPEQNGRAIVVSDSVAYIGEGDGLSLWNVSDPSHPTIMAHVPLPNASAAIDIQVVSEHAYVINGGSSFYIIDIHDLQNPTLMGSYTTPDTAWHLHVVDQLVYVVASLGGFQIVDVSNPITPTLLGTYNTENGDEQFLDLDVSGDLVYIAGGFAGLIILDTSDPTHPQLLGQYDPPIGPYDNTAAAITLEGSMAYVTGLGVGLQIVDVHDPQNPTPRGTYAFDVFAFKIQVVNGFVYVLQQNVVLVIDVRNPDSPTWKGSYDTSGLDIQVEENLLYVVDRQGGLQIIDLNSAQINLFRAGKAIQIVDEIAYIADGHNGLWLVDIHDIQHPLVIGNYNTPGYAMNLQVSNQLAYLADGGGLQIIDASTPMSPTLVGSFESGEDGGYVSALELSENLVYLARKGRDLVILDVSNPLSPTLLGQTSGELLGEIATDIELNGHFIYLMSLGAGISIIDVQDPEHPLLVGSYATYGDLIQIAGDLLYTTAGTELLFVDVSNPSTPSLLNRYSVPGDYIQAIEIVGNLAYISCVDSLGSYILILDVSDPLHPVPYWSTTTARQVLSMTVIDTSLYLVSKEGIQVLVPQHVFLPIVHR